MASKGRAVRTRAALLVSALLLALQGCAFERRAWEPEALRHEIAARVGDARPEELAVLFELDPELEARAHRVVLGRATRSERAQALLDFIFDARDGLALRYALSATATASETVAAGEGNCLALASVFVGLARAVGLRAFYLDATDRVDEVLSDGDLVVHVGHLSAVVDTERGDLAMDFGWDLDDTSRLVRIGDLEATAHYHNNLGFEAVDGGRVEWAAAARRFEVATRIAPDFARAWSNLGLARARLGDEAEALRCYRRAIELDPELVAPRVNLGAALLRIGDAKGALESFEAVLELDPDRADAERAREIALARMRDEESEAVDLRSLWDFDDPAASEARFRELATRAAAEGDVVLALAARTQVARALGLRGRFDEAFAELDAIDAEVRPEQHEQHELRVRSALERGRALRSSGDPESSRAPFRAAWELATEHGEEALAIDAAHMLALVEPAERSREWTRRGIERARASSDPAARYWLGPLESNLGFALLEEGDTAGALEHLRAALDARLEQGEAEPIRIARWAVAHAERLAGDVDAALAEQRALEREMEAAGAEPDGFVVEEIAECLLARGEADAARPYFRRAHELLSKLDWLAGSEPERLSRLEELGGR